MSIDFGSVALAFLSGMVFGAGYLAILWGSIRSLARSHRPIARLLGGAVLRIGVLLGLFYLIMDGHGERLLASLAGFMAVRIAVAWWMGGRAAPGPTR